MDDKLRSVLGNEELMAQIAAAVRGSSAPASPPQAPPPVADAVPTFTSAGGKSDSALALLSALAPFLRESRRSKLEAVTKAMAVANIYKNTKII